MRNVYKKWEINSAKMNKAICAEWDGKLRALSRLLAARTGTDERFFAFLGMQDKNGDNPGQMDKKIPVSFDTGISSWCRQRESNPHTISSEGF